MLRDQATFEKELQVVVAGKDKKSIFDFMEDNFALFFASPDIVRYYQLVRHVDVSETRRAIPKLVFAWLAFVSGDNSGLQHVLRAIDVSSLKAGRESSCYYSLVALLGTGERGSELAQAKLAVDALRPDDESFYMANAKLTYAQLLAGHDQYRAAADLFNQSHLLFLHNELLFPAVVALVNEMLNRFKLGQLGAVIKECERALALSASFRSEAAEFWDIVHLPLGMCYFEMNKPSLALKHLQLAKDAIDRLNMFHMHGFCEYYLFRCLYLLDDREGMASVRAQAVADFAPMNFPYTDILLATLNLLYHRFDGTGEIQADVERIELEYLSSKERSSLMTLEMAACLRIAGLSNALHHDVLVAALDRVRFTGHVSAQQLFLVLLAELLYREGNVKTVKTHLKEAVSIYRECGMSANFFCMPLQCVRLLADIDAALYGEIGKRYKTAFSPPETPLLSDREREIMQLVAAGNSNEEIGKALYIGVGTIKWHLNRVFSKLEVSNRLQAVERARQLGEIRQ